MTTPRFQVHDEDGPLRAFWTRQAAEAWMLPGMSLVELPREPRKTRRAILNQALATVGTCLF